MATVPALASFGEEAAGGLYAISHTGAVYRFELPDSKAASPAFPTLLSQTGLFTELASLTPQPGLLPYDVSLHSCLRSALVADGNLTLI